MLYTIYYAILHTTLYSIVYHTIYCTIYYTIYYTVYYTIYCTIYYTILYTIQNKVLYTLWYSLIQMQACCFSECSAWKVKLFFFALFCFIIIHFIGCRHVAFLSSALEKLSCFFLWFAFWFSFHWFECNRLFFFVSY